MDQNKGASGRFGRTETSAKVYVQYVAIIRTSGIAVLRTWIAYVLLAGGRVGGVICPMGTIGNSSRDEYDRALLPFYQSFS